MTEMEILQTTTDPIEMDMGDPVIEYSPVYPNPEGDPTDDLTKVQIQGDIYKVKDPEVHDWARAEEKPTYTKDEVGLGNADNTSDIDKPVSTATQTALDNKVDKVAGKGLSTNDFTNDFKTKLDGIEAGAEVNTVNSVAGKTGNITLDKSDVGLGNVDNTSDMNKPVSTATQTALNGKVDNSTLNNYYTKTQTDSALSLKANSSSVYTKTEADNLLNGKVDKEEGKGLSKNDFTDTLKSKLDGIEAEANKTIVDNALDGTSANPVENRVVKSALDEKLNADETAVNSNGLVIATPVTDTAPYIYRQTPVKESFKALMKKIVGASVVWNQMIRPIASDYWEVYSGTGSFSNGEMTVTDAIGRNGARLKTSYNTPLIENHIYYFGMDYKTTVKLEWRCVVANQNLESATYTRFSKVAKYTTVSSIYERGDIYPQVSQAQGTFSLKNAFLVDLTAMFGTTIADYVYTLEQSETGSGIAWLQSYGFFTEDYYAYKQNKLESGCVSAKKIVETNQAKMDNANNPNRSSFSYTKETAQSIVGTKTVGGGNFFAQFEIDLISGKTYTFSFGKFETNGTENANVNVYIYSDRLWGTSIKANWNVSKDGSTWTSTYNGKAYVGIFTTASVDTVLELDGFMASISGSTSFEPYTETTYPISPITLRGLFKLSTDKLTVDGDEYNADGSVTRKRAIAIYDGSEDEDWKYEVTSTQYKNFYIKVPDAKAIQTNTSLICNKIIVNSINGAVLNGCFISGGKNFNATIGDMLNINNVPDFKTWLSNNNLVIEYELATPTTEQTTPFTETEIVGSTEEFIDYEVTQGNRDVAIPVGTDTDYYQEMKLPSLPTTSGNHNLIYNIATGFGWS